MDEGSEMSLSQTNEDFNAGLVVDHGSRDSFSFDDQGADANNKGEVFKPTKEDVQKLKEAWKHVEKSLKT
jgi:hypothetical protein